MFLPCAIDQPAGTVKVTPPGPDATLPAEHRSLAFARAHHVRLAPHEPDRDVDEPADRIGDGAGQPGPLCWIARMSDYVRAG